MFRQEVSPLAVLSHSFGEVVHSHAKIVELMTAITIRAYSIAFFACISFICTIACVSICLG